MAKSDHKDYHTSDNWLNEPENGVREKGKFYIEDTRGLWVRKNLVVDELEIWYDGKFQCSWRDANEIECRLTAMLRAAFEIGEREKLKKLREFLGCQ